VGPVGPCTVEAAPVAGISGRGPGHGPVRLEVGGEDRVLGEREDIFDAAESENRQLLQGLKDIDRDPNININSKYAYVYPLKNKEGDTVL
jgi:hypothetical protein